MISCDGKNTESRFEASETFTEILLDDRANVFVDDISRQQNDIRIQYVDSVNDLVKPPLADQRPEMDIGGNDDIQSSHLGVLSWK